MRACVNACVRECVRECVRTRVRACRCMGPCVRACVRVSVPVCVRTWKEEARERGSQGDEGAERAINMHMQVCTCTDTSVCMHACMQTVSYDLHVCTDAHVYVRTYVCKYDV